MSYYVSNMFGIRTGGVFKGSTDVTDMKKRIAKLVLEQRASEDMQWDLGDKNGDISHCMSQELEAHKGSYILIGGVFNYWTYKSSSTFAKSLSKEFGTEVMHMCWDEEENTVQCQVWLDGKPLFEINENPIGQILRRVY